MAQHTSRLKCPFCRYTKVISNENEVSMFREMLDHVRGSHKEKDQTPAVLWDQIDIVR